MKKDASLCGNHPEKKVDKLLNNNDDAVWKA